MYQNPPVGTVWRIMITSAVLKIIKRDVGKKMYKTCLYTGAIYPESCANAKFFKILAIKIPSKQ